MAGFASPLTPIYENSAKIAWLTRLRWAVIILQCLALIPGVLLGFVHTANILIYLGVISSAFFFNLGSQFLNRDQDVPNSWVSVQLFFDVTQFGVLLCLAGGWQNPFSSLMFIYAAIGGALLSPANIVRLAAYVIVLIAVIQKFFSYKLVTKYPGIDVYVNIAVEVTVVVSIVLMLASLSRSLINREKTLTEIKDRHLRMDRLRAIGTLTGGFCHQMASPINSIKLRASRLLRKTQQDHCELYDDVESIQTSVERCEAVLKKLTNIHLDPKQVIFQHQDLTELVQTCLSIWQRDPNHVNVQVHTKLPGPTYLNLPGIMMTQAILDLLDNGAEATDFKGNIWLSLRAEGKMLHLTIEDDGEGFPEHIQKNLGEPFNTSKPAGNGLGLYHASLLAQLLGGHLEVAARSPKGARITLIFDKEKCHES